MTTNTFKQHSTAVYPVRQHGTAVCKRKFNFALGIERNFKAYSEFFGLGSLSDHLYFTGFIATVLLVMIVTLSAKIQTGGL